MLDDLALYGIYILTGIIAGVIGGLLGVGGGVITVPAFFIIFILAGLPHQALMPLAVGTSLAAMIFNTLSASWAHHRRGAVQWDIFTIMAPGLIIGSCFGAVLIILLPEIALAIFFGIFLCCLSIVFFRNDLFRFNFSASSKSSMLRIASLAIGTLSNILGIGGGVLSVPFLMGMHVPDKQAIGTSSAMTLLVSILGTATYVLLRLNYNLGAGNIGYVNIPACLIVGIATFFAAPYGVKLTHQLPLQKIRKIFAVVLIFSGLSFIILNLWLDFTK